MSDEDDSGGGDAAPAAAVALNDDDDEGEQLVLPLGVANLVDAGINAEGFQDLVHCAARDGRTVMLFALLAEKVHKDPLFFK